MKKTTLIWIVVALFLVLGVVFVSAHIADEKPAEVSDTETSQPAQPTCSSGTCNFQCKGNCGVPTCGCSR